jgi:hypothetical protein
MSVSPPGPITLPGRNVLPPVSLRAPSPARPATAVRIGAAMGVRQLLRRAVALHVALALLLSLSAALVERSAAKAGAVDRALDAVFGLLLPLAVFALVAELCGRGNLRRAAWSAAKFGVARRDVAIGMLLPALALAVVLGALMSTVAVVFTHSAAVPMVARDILVGAWVAALSACAYVGWFAFGSTFFARGGGRWLVLAIDFVIGGTLGVAGAVLPRANVHNLLGGAPPLGVAQPVSAAILAVTAVALCSLAAVRCRD